MPELSDSQIDKLEKGMDAIIELRAVVLGVGGKGGLMQDVEETKQEVRLAVREMTLKTSASEANVAKLLNDIIVITPKVSRIEKSIFGNGKEGLEERVGTTEKKQADNRKLIMAMWTFTGILLVALLSLLIQHMS